ncbi:OmpW/AlkL family protein [Microbulbifer sp. 2201CG32-9]|uniref:OmpW/AlkL family protein n=1 Tax=Microbulbifer sp. 2201CG32-9 TaxID=3232309 RepID=UPI00345C32A3
MTLKSLLIPLAAVGFAGLAAESAMAGPSGYPMQQPPPVWGAGTFVVRIGATYADPDDDFRERTTTFIDDPVEGRLDVVNRVDLNDDTNWFVNATWVFMDHWAVELYHANDLNFSAHLTSEAFFEREFIGELRERLGDFDTYFTSLFVDWYFLDPTCLWQPYVGLGVNYTDISNDFVRPVFPTNNRFGAGNVSFGSDFSWTAQAGVDLVLGHHSNWVVSASVMYIDASPDVHIGFDAEAFVPGFDDPAIVSVRTRDEVDMDSWVFNLGFGYKFSF